MLMVVEEELSWCNPYQSTGRISSLVYRQPREEWEGGMRGTCREQAKDLGTRHFTLDSHSDLHLTDFNIIVRIPIFPGFSPSEGGYFCIG